MVEIYCLIHVQILKKWEASWKLVEWLSAGESGHWQMMFTSLPHGAPALLGKWTNVPFCQGWPWIMGALHYPRFSWTTALFSPTPKYNHSILPHKVRGRHSLEEGTQHNLQEGRMKWFLQEVMYELGRDGNDVHSDIILLCVCVSQHRGLGGEQKLGSCPPPSGAPPTPHLNSFSLLFRLKWPLSQLSLPPSSELLRIWIYSSFKPSLLCQCLANRHLSIWF